jgi:hypothetical protein
VRGINAQIILVNDKPGRRSANCLRDAADRGELRQAAGAAPQVADLRVVVGAVDAGVMMRAMMLWLLLRILGLRNARGYCAPMSS